MMIDNEIIKNVRVAIKFMDEMHIRFPENHSSALDSLKAYLNTGNAHYITSKYNCRSYISSLPKDKVIEALKVIYHIDLSYKKTTPKVYKSIGEIINNVNDQMSTYNNLSIIEKEIEKANKMRDNPYKFLVRCITKKPKSVPSTANINSFYGRFSDRRKYDMLDQNGYFSHIKSRNFDNDTAESKFYINTSNLTEALLFARMFANKCESRGIPFYFKTTQMMNNNIRETQLTRDETVVIYSSKRYFVDYVNIFNEIKSETNIVFLQPPILSGSIDGFIGFGQDPKDNCHSYNEIRANFARDAVRYANENLMRHYPNYRLEDVLAYIRKNEAFYKSYLQDINYYMHTKASMYGINPNKLFLNLESGVDEIENKRNR